jgi:hypothetical protein
VTTVNYLSHRVQTLTDRVESLQLHKPGGKGHNQKLHGARRSATAAAWDASLSKKENNQVELWMWGDNTTVRGMLASGGKNAKEKARVSTLKDALDKAPAYTGTAYRGMTFDSKSGADRFVKSLVDGGGYTEGSISSFSKSRGIANEFAIGRGARGSKTKYPDSVMLKVKMKDGSDISSRNAREREVLNRNGARYRTTSVTRATTKSAVTINLEEL